MKPPTKPQLVSAYADSVDLNKQLEKDHEAQKVYYTKALKELSEMWENKYQVLSHKYSQEVSSFEQKINILEHDLKVQTARADHLSNQQNASTIRIDTLWQVVDILSRKS